MQSVNAAPAFRPGRLRPRTLVLVLSLAHALAAHAQTVASASPASSTPSATLTFEAALASAGARNSAIPAAQSSVDAGMQAVIGAGQLPNPTLMAGIDTLPINGDQAYTIGQNILTMRRIGIEQEWVSPRKRALQSDLAARKVDVEQAGYLAQLATVRERTAIAWLDAAYAKRAVALREALVEHMAHELAATEASYRGARAAATDVAQARLMQAGTRDDLLKARQAFQIALIALSRWTASAVADVAGEPPAPQSAVAALPADQLARVDPALMAAAADVRVADADVAVSESRRSPNWAWSVSYLQGGGNARFVSVGVSIPLPIHRSSVEDRDVAGKADLATKARLTLEDTRRQVDADIRTLSATLASGRERVAGLQAGLLPAADARADLAVAAYRAGTGSLADTFAARRAQLDAQLQVLDLQREVALTWAQLEYQVVPPALAVNP